MHAAYISIHLHAYIHAYIPEIFDGNRLLWLAESTKIKHMKNNIQQNGLHS